MKSKKIFTLMIAVGLGAAMVSCRKDPVTDDEVLMGNIIEQYVDHTIAPTYSSLAAKSAQLVDALEDLQESRTDANVAAACNIFLEARAQWEMSEAFLFGPAGDFGIDPHIDSWPLDESAFNTLMNSPAMIEALDGDDGDVVAGERLGNALLGFHGIEYILFSNGQPKSAAQITDNEMIYVVAVAGDLRNRCFQLEVSWLGSKAPADHREVVEELELNCTVGNGNSFGTNMRNAGQAGSTYSSRAAAIMEIVDGCAAIADEVGTSKIGKPHNGEDVTYIESPYSQKSIQDFYDNIISVQNAYMGGVAGQRNAEHSVQAFVNQLNPDLDARVQSAINNALTKIQNMQAPFVQNYTHASAGAASEACQQLDSVLGEVIEAIRTM